MFAEDQVSQKTEVVHVLTLPLIPGGLEQRQKHHPCLSFPRGIIIPTPKTSKFQVGEAMRSTWRCPGILGLSINVTGYWGYYFYKGDGYVHARLSPQSPWSDSINTNGVSAQGWGVVHCHPLPLPGRCTGSFECQGLAVATQRQEQQLRNLWTLLLRRFLSQS